MGEEQFLFSIIVPVYNTEKYINKCLSSIEKAMDTDCEVIIVNDGSTDDSKKVIQEYINNLPDKYKNNFIYTEKENKGLADTKNVGIKMARGKFISVVDSDDYISEEFYTIARKYVDKYNIIIYDLYIIYENNSKQNYTSRAYRDYIENELASYLNGAMSGSSCNKIIKKELYNNHSFPVGKEYEDTAVTPFILSECKKIKYVPYPMYYYLQREKSIVASNTFASAFYKICSNITDVLKDLKDEELEKYKYVIVEFFVDRILDNLSEDFKQNKNEFTNNLNKFITYNEKVIKYIKKNDLVYNCENHYTENQKSLVKEMFNDLNDKNSKAVINLINKREMLHKIRRILHR